MVSVPQDQLTARQLLLYRVIPTLNRLDKFMADLTSSVAGLQAAVDNIAVRFASQIVPLQEALAAAQAANDETNAELTQALADASAAADSINSEVAELNAIGAAPEVPVETVPVEELPPPPSEETPA